MDKDLKDILTYGLGTLVSYSVIIGFINTLTKNIKDTIVYVLLITIFMWLIYLQVKISKRQGGKKNDKR